MKQSVINTQLSKDVKETVSALVNTMRSKVISTADVWNIQRRKRSFVQRRFAL